MRGMWKRRIARVVAFFGLFTLNLSIAFAVVDMPSHVVGMFSVVGGAAVTIGAFYGWD